MISMLCQAHIDPQILCRTNNPSVASYIYPITQFKNDGSRPTLFQYLRMVIKILRPITDQYHLLLSVVKLRNMLYSTALLTIWTLKTLLTLISMVLDLDFPAILH